MESMGTILKRTVRTGREVGFLRDLIAAKWTGVPRSLPVVVREGVSLRTVHHLNACLHPQRKAVVDERRELTFVDANDEINRLANAMRDRFGVGRKEPVVVAMRNRAEYMLIWMAISRLGASTVHASWRQTAEELEYQIEHSGARLVFAGPSVSEALDGVQDRGTIADLSVVGVDDAVDGISYTELVDAADPDFPYGDGEEQGSENIVYTSGTTGRPKGAVRDMAGYGVVDLFRILERLPVRTGERHLVVSPLYHSGAQVFSVLQTALGATLYLLPDFDPEKTLETLHNRAINSIFMVPTMLRRILNLPDEVLDRYPTPSLRGIFCGAAPFSQALRRRAIDHFGASVIHDFYGATEIGWITLINGEEMLERPGSVGRPIAGQQVRIVDDDGRDVGTNEKGKIYVRNDHIMAGYLDNPEATDEIVDDGWMTVDDLGYLDEDGYLYISGRARDMVISGGVNIYPAEIESVLEGHEGIREAAVIGVPDEEFGESLQAFVAVDGDVDEASVEEYAREHLSGYKVPRKWHFVDQLPRNPTGKILKRDLEPQLEARSPGE